MSVANETFDAMDPTTFATRTSADRSRAAKQQARDRFGRWITQGASVQWRTNGQDYAGTILRIENNQAVVKVKNADDTGATLTLPPKSLRVTTSKASLENKDIPSMATEDTNEEAVNRPEFNDQLDETGTAAVKRDDGYFIEAHKKADIGGNPLLYQLYAPNGRSLGKFTKDALPNFEEMIAEDKDSGEDQISINGDIVPASPESLLPGGPVAASAAPTSVLRISRDGTSLIVQDNSVFKVIDKVSGKAFVQSSRLDTLLAAGSWRKTVDSEKDLSAHVISTKDIEIIVNTTPQYRVPNNVKEAITAALNQPADLTLSDEDRLHMLSLATDNLVSLESVNWINKFFADYEKPENLHGGYHGKKWAAKIVNNSADKKSTKNDCFSGEVDYDNFDDDTFVYLGIGHDVDSGTAISELLSIDLETDAVYNWKQGEFVLDANTYAQDLDAPAITVLDAETAKTVARWIDLADSTPTLDVLDVNPEERNLFSLAYAELDFEEIDRISTIIADASGYTPVERSVNAQRQKRGPGGKFGGEQVPQSSNLAAGVTKKATLPFELPLVENIQALIASWLETAEDFSGTITAAGQAYGGSPIDIDQEAPVSEITAEEAAPTETPEAEVTAESTTEPVNDNILYFAIVDPVDKTAVTDVVALIKKDGQPAAWLRSGSTWVRSAEKLSDLQGATPPAVVKLEVPEPVKGVLTQIDSYDQEKGVDTTEMPIAASGFTLFDNTLEIMNANDLVKSVFTVSEISDPEYLIFAKHHIRKRARALNRMDLVPVEWRETQLSDIGVIEHNSSPLFGDFGEIIVASGIPGIADTPADFKNVERLMNYWAHGKGALKIRWGTPGDLTRAHRHLVKYVGPMRAWGLAQNLHKRVFGVANITHDRATGQYRGRR